MASIFRTLRRKSGGGGGGVTTPSRSPRSGRASKAVSCDNLGPAVSVISLDFRELTCDDVANGNDNNCDSCVDASENNPNNPANNNHVYVDLDTLSPPPPAPSKEERSDSKNNLLLEEKPKADQVDAENNVEEKDKPQTFAQKFKNRIKKSASAENYSNAPDESTFKEKLKSFTKSENYQPLSDLESAKVKKKRGRRKLFRQPTEERDLVSAQEIFEEIQSPEERKKSRSFSIMSHLRKTSKQEDSKQIAEQMANQLSEIKFLFETEAREIEFKEILEDDLTWPTDDGPQSFSSTAIHSHSADFTSMPPVPVTDLDDPEPVVAKTKAKGGFKSKLAQNFKARFRLKKQNKHKKLEEEFCRQCTKKRRPSGLPVEAEVDDCTDYYCLCEIFEATAAGASTNSESVSKRHSTQKHVHGKNWNTEFLLFKIAFNQNFDPQNEKIIR